METSSAAGRLAPREAPTPAERVRLAEAWSHEFLHVAMMSAFVTMGCNGLALRGSAAGMAAVEVNIPDEPAVNRAIRQGLLELPDGFETLNASAQRAYDSLERAITEFRAVQGARADLVTATSLARLASVWRETAELMLVALEHFSAKRLLPAHEVINKDARHRCPTRVRELLTEAMESRMLKASDRPPPPPTAQLPKWVQRRRWTRKSLDLDCRVEARGQSYTTTLRNISMGGALLGGLPFLMRGTPISLSLDNGRRLEATIMWARDSNAGIKFNSQLAFDDPLISEPQEE